MNTLSLCSSLDGPWQEHNHMPIKNTDTSLETCDVLLWVECEMDPAGSRLNAWSQTVSVPLRGDC